MAVHLVTGAIISNLAPGLGWGDKEVHGMCGLGGLHKQSSTLGQLLTQPQMLRPPHERF